VIPFEKWHGLGNDFVVVRADDLPDAPIDYSAWCDRHRGVGADGVLVVSDRPGDSGLDMVVHNADGSVPEICGNGIRCAVLSWARRRGLVEGTVEVGTGAGTRLCRFTDGEVEVEMGRARLAPVEPAVLLPDADWVGEPGSVRSAAVDMGNPHLVLFGGWPGSIDAGVAARLEHHEAFPARANVSFVRFGGSAEAGLDVRVWERGVGFTAACGTAACASAAAAVAAGLATAGAPVPVHLPGGTLRITISESVADGADGGAVAMRGPAAHVFDGEISSELRVMK
jgi:diaminopimelate epimerase